MLSINPATLFNLLFDAGNIAISYFRKTAAVKKPDNSLVTAADLVIDQFLTEKLKAIFPDYQIFSEEQDHYNFDTKAPFTWVIDPLDGTTAFVNGLPEWGIALGLMHAETPCFGMFYMPLLHQVTYGERGKSAYFRPHVLNGRVSSTYVRQDWSSKGFLAVSSASWHREFTIELQRVRTVGSASSALAYVAQGVATAVLLPKARLWDLVPLVPVIEQAGGVLCYLSGRPIVFADLYNGRLAPEPIIAAHPDVIPQLQASIHNR
jgi:myo-inositol-1(or 4)-monophosphatase